MVAAGVPLRATVLKMAHHGSRNAADRAFLAAVSPQIAVASAGRNNEYGLPSPVALARVAAVGAQVYRTDEDGAVEIISDGERVSVRTARGR
jgi:competence protein ComEC